MRKVNCVGCDKELEVTIMIGSGDTETLNDYFCVDCKRSRRESKTLELLKIILKDNQTV